MKKYIAELDRDSISLDLGFKIAVIHNGTVYSESEVTTKFPKYFKEVKGEETDSVAKEEILLVDDSSKVEVKTEEAPVEQSEVDSSTAEEAPVEVKVEEIQEAPVESSEDDSTSDEQKTSRKKS
jgi:hypothetical protein